VGRVREIRRLRRRVRIGASDRSVTPVFEDGGGDRVGGSLGPGPTDVEVYGRLKRGVRLTIRVSAAAWARGHVGTDFDGAGRRVDSR
jgi:hypothetical protein